MVKGILLVALSLALEGAFLLQAALPSGIGGAPAHAAPTYVARRAQAPAPVAPAAAPAACTPGTRC